MNKNIILKHICKNQYTVRADTFLIRGKGRCPFCNKRRITKEMLNEYIDSNNEYSLTKNINKNILIKKDEIEIFHSKCKTSFKTNVNNFYFLKHGCPNCRNPTIKMVKTRLYNLVGNEYKILSNDYKNSNEKLEFFHTTCKTKFLTAANNFFNDNQRCNCQNKHKNKGSKKFIEEFNHISNGEYILLSEYKNSRSKIKILHKQCNKTYDTIANNFIGGHRCPYCFKGNKYSEKDFLNKLSTNTKVSFTFISKYAGMKKYITIKHNECGKEFSTRAGYFIKHQTCKYCNKSFGELEISKFLDSHNIKYQTEKTFTECKDKKRLPFDFYIQNRNLLIEFDGEQHFKPVFGEKSFLSTKKHDKIKDEFAKKNKINLIRIKYTEFNNIKNILNKTLNDYPELE